MQLVIDRGAQAAAVHTLRGLIDAGFAGLDCYDHDIFVVDTPLDQERDHAEIALGILDAVFLQVGPIGRTQVRIECRLPREARAELGLDGPDAPELIVPLASRGVRTDQLTRDWVTV